MPEQKGRWFSLLSFCFIRATVAALAIAIVAIVLSVTYAVAQSSKPPRRSNLRNQGVASARNFSGVVTDSECAARHAKESGLSPAECTRACVRDGAKYVLVDGDKIYNLGADPVNLSKVAGQRVRITGSLFGDTIRVNSIDASPEP